MPYLITKRARDGTETPVHFEPNTLEACAGAMAALTCGNRRDARHALHTTSYTASNAAGEFLTARYVAGSRDEAIRTAQRSGAWPMPKPCRYCGFVATRMSDEDCPAKPLRLRLWQWITGAQ